MFSYNEVMQDTIEKIEEEKTTYKMNKLYKNVTYGWYWYRNTKGYFHINKPCKISYDGEFSHYEIEDFLLTKNNTLKLISSYGFFKNKENIIAELENQCNN